jgi:hypothetical protein
MTDFRLKVPKILWGAAFANTLTLPYPLDGMIAGPEPRAGSETAQAPSGVEDAWTIGTDYVLEADARWIPQSLWDGATGFAAFLTWARDKNVLRFYPDKDAGTYIDSYLVEPMSGQGEPESDGTRKVRFRIRNSTTAYDGY